MHAAATFLFPAPVIYLPRSCAQIRCPPASLVAHFRVRSSFVASTRKQRRSSRAHASNERAMARAPITITVPDGAVPGDVCIVDLPDGSCVNVIVPEGAAPGTLINCMAGDEERRATDADGATSSPDARKLASALTARLHWESRVRRSQSMKAPGLTNAKVDRGCTRLRSCQRVTCASCCCTWTCRTAALASGSPCQRARNLSPRSSSNLLVATARRCRSSTSSIEGSSASSCSPPAPRPRRAAHGPAGPRLAHPRPLRGRCDGSN